MTPVEPVSGRVSADTDPTEAIPFLAVPDRPAASQELERRPEVLNPLTGELIPADDLTRIAAAVDMIRERKRDLDAFVAAMTDAVAVQSRLQGTRTFHLEGGVSLVLSGDTEIEWDIGVLNEGLSKAGCPEERLYDLVQTTVTYKVNQAVARQLAAANPAYKAAIEAAQTRVPKRASLSVKLR